MVVSMVKPKWILELCCWKYFYSGLHMTLECRDTKLWPISSLGASQCLSTLKGGAKPTQTEHTPQSTPIKLKTSKWMDHAKKKEKISKFGRK
jgi:hypothetical protein